MPPTRQRYVTSRHVQCSVECIVFGRVGRVFEAHRWRYHSFVKRNGGPRSNHPTKFTPH